MGAVLTQLAPVIGALGGAASGAASGQLSAQQLAQTYALNKRGQALQEANNANALERQTQTNPLRDQTLYSLAGMLGASPAAFNPTSMLSGTNTGPQGVGGVNQNALANYNAAYTPGAGGVTSNVQQMILNRLGYGNVKTGTLFDNPSTPADSLTGTPAAAQTTGATNQGGQGVTPPADPYSASQNAGYTNSNPETGSPAQTTPGTTGGGIGGPGSAVMSATPFKLAALGGLGGAPAVASAAGGMAGSAPALSAAPGTTPPAALTPGGTPGTTGAMTAAQQAALMARLTGGNLAAS